MRDVLTAAGISLVVSLFGTSVLIELFRRRGLREVIRSDGPESHQKKSGTPTMGGIAIIVAATVGYVLARVDFSPFDVKMQPEGLSVLITVWLLGMLGAVDDLAKVRQKSLGLNKRAKFAGQIAVGIAVSWMVVKWVEIEPAITFAGFKVSWIPALGFALFTVWVVLFVAGTSNAVNLTDGLDGLACGSGAIALFVYLIIAFWQSSQLAIYFDSPAGRLENFIDLATIAAALLGACIGFLWWNANPAQIFMGDTGSLAIGGGLAVLALVSRTQLLLALIGGIFVIETVSVMIQVFTFRLMNKRRLFLMTPIHHHFELKGWAETTVIVRFWLIAALCSGFGLAVFYERALAVLGI